ncbi:MAG TPA: VOC family protein [Plantibacter sp.]|uniref:VOC family protein n=1 Tax=unclassified Plantibacter TaxID=2624265 RepID=UPI002BE62776|nr:VOC family protein [Plantibacter sp.]
MQRSRPQSSVAPGVHHVEVWLADVEAERASWAWLLPLVGFALSSEWSGGESWGAGDIYLTLTASPNLSAVTHDRRRPGVNHLAFRGGSREEVDAIMSAAPENGWRPLYQERYPHAGGEEHYAGWLENAAGFKVEVVADPVVGAARSVYGAAPPPAPEC